MRCAPCVLMCQNLKGYTKPKIHLGNEGDCSIFSQSTIRVGNRLNKPEQEASAETKAD